MRNRFQVLTVLSCSLFAMNSFAADLYVSVNNAKATDASTNPGTNPNIPLKSIQRAAALAVKGTTVHVAAGTYNVSAPGLDSYGINSTNSGTATARIRFVSDPKNRAKIVVSGTGIAWNSRGSYVDIDGFEITGSGRHGILAWGAHLSITNNYIHDITVSGGCNGSGGSGIDTPNTVGDVLISNNIVRNIGYSMIGSCNTVQGIYIASPNNTVINNIVSGVALAGIQQWHGATASAIINNTVFHCKDGILIGDGDAGALPNGSENNYVANNIVYDNLAYGIIELGKVGANNRYVKNLIYKSGTSLKVAGTQSGNLIKDPLFVSYQANGSGNYHLQVSSPAIGQGALTSAPSTDFDGKARGSSIDIGAYEYAAAPSPSPTPTGTTWVKCAVEGGTCVFSGTKTVRYGTGSYWTTKTATGSIACTNAVFGDPAHGYVKECDVAQ